LNDKFIELLYVFVALHIQQICTCHTYCRSLPHPFRAATKTYHDEAKYIKGERTLGGQIYTKYNKI